MFVTALCVGSPLAINIKAVLSPFGLAIVLLLFAFHTSSFVAGYHLAGTWFRKSADVKALQRTISFETGICGFPVVLGYVLCNFFCCLTNISYRNAK